MANSGIINLIVSDNKKKREAEFELLMDDIEDKGMSQLRTKYNRYEAVYRQMNGRPTIDTTNKDTLRVIARQMGEEQAQLVERLNDREIKNYDFMFSVADKVIQTMLEIDDKVEIESIDPESRAEYDQYKTAAFRETLERNMKSHIDELCVLRGISPIIDENASEDERQKMLADIEQVKQEFNYEKTLEAISLSYRDIAVIFAQNTMAVDKERFRINDKIRYLLLDFLISGEFFIVPTIKQGHYEPDVWRQYETFYEAKAGLSDPQKCSRIGRQRLLTHNEIIEEYGRYLSADHKKSVIDGVNYTYSDNKYLKFQGLLDAARNLNSTLVFGDRSQVNTLNTTGTVIGDESDSISMTDLIKKPDIIDSMGRTDISSFGRQLVTEVYYKTYRKVGLLKMTDENGNFVEKSVTEKVFKDIIKDNKIKEIDDKSEYELRNDKNENIIFWDYEEEVRWGLKIALTNMSKSNKPFIYVGGDRVEIELKGESDKVGKRFPTAGVIGGVPILKKISNYQANFDALMSESDELMAKNQGLITVLNPKYFQTILNGTEKDPGKAMNTYLSIVKELGVALTDLDQQQAGAGGAAAPMHLIDASTTSKAIETYKYAKMMKMEAYEIMEIPLQYNPINVENNGGESVNVGTTTVMESIFDRFSEGMLRFWDTHIEFAKYCKSKGIDKYDQMTRSIADRAYLSHEEMLKVLNKKLHIYSKNNAKGRRELREMRMMLSQNTAQMPTEQRFEYYLSDSPTKILAKAAEFSKKQELVAQQNAEYQKMIAADSDLKEKERINLKYEWEFKIEKMKASATLAGKQYTPMGFQDDKENIKEINRINEQQLDALNRQYDDITAAQSLAIEKYRNRNASDMDERTLALKERELDIKSQMSKDKTTQSVVNKNQYDFKKPVK